MPKQPEIFDTIMVSIADLKPHPRNYQEHPPEQIQHLMDSIMEHGLYRNIVISQDNTILAGHGVVEAAKALDLKYIPVVQLPVNHDSPAALKVLVGDNEINHMVEVDDRALSEILKTVLDSDVQGLAGTGYDERKLAELVYVTRPEAEVNDFKEAAEWAGASDLDIEDEPLKIVVSFRDQLDRMAFFGLLGQAPLKPDRKTISIWFDPDLMTENIEQE